MIEVPLARICCGDAEAMDFIRVSARLCDEVDDIVDKERTSPEEIIATIALSVVVYSHPFYIRNIVSLRHLFLQMLNTYADSVAWATDPILWKREMANHLRETGTELLLAVALICGGYAHMRQISQELREIIYRAHNPEQKAVA